MFNMFIFAKVVHSKFFEMHGDTSYFYPPHWYFILDTGFILRPIELFIYIQTCVNDKAYAIKQYTLNYSSFIPLLQSDLRSDK